MTNFRPIFENDWCGIETFLKDVLSPVFGEYEQGYDILTNDSDVREKAKNANITEIRHAATFDFFGSELKVFDITVGDNKKLENNKVGIQAIVRQYINQFEGALIIFHHQKVENQEWRFSYVEKRVNAKDSTSAKRYTYILGKGHPARTIAERFKDLESKKDKDETILLPALTNAFSVAPLSDDFFNEYREHYADLVEYISGKRFVKKGGKFVEEKTKNANSAFKSVFDGDDKLVRDYVKKMMGRLVFLHFLQKKGWLGVPVNAEWGSGDKNFIYNLFKNADENIKSDFLEQALEPLFFNTLNNNRGEESIAPKVICDIYGSKIRIPYLNGGLFEEDELDTKQVKFKKEHFEELLEFFNQYNFTIDETDPDDQEIGVDPEMLGKIFENLLEDNKDKGAFYTPKEIVQYMCRESLIAYLQEKTGIDTRDFVINHTHTFNESQKANILKALLDVKICDPAVGSGAFPMGMMNELLACTQLLTGETKTRSWLKKHIVKNNIYGVDIEKGAVDIARLRFWLAIIVDEKEPIPLPNLDYKIMQGNSLLECYNGVDLSHMLEAPSTGELDYNEEQRTLLKTNMDEYFDDNNHKDKTQKNDVIKSLVYDLASATCGFSKNSEKDLELHEKIWDGTTDFFLWHTWFNDVFNRPNDCNGFDIVIGNPPYIKELGNEKVFAPINDTPFGKKYHAGKMDYWFFFMHKALEILKKNGIISFITSRYWINSSGAKKLIKNIKETSEFINIVDIGDLKVFDNVVGHHMISILTNSLTKRDCHYLKISTDVENISKSVFDENRLIKADDLINSDLEIVVEKRKNIKTSLTLDNVCFVSQGIVEASDRISQKMYKNNPDPKHYIGEGIFVLTKEETDKLKLTQEESNILELYEDSGCINRYHIDYSKTRNLIYSDVTNRQKIENEKNFSNLKKHLDYMSDYITSTYKPYGLHRARDYNDFIQNKIIGPSMFETPCFAYDNKKLFVGMSYNIVTAKDDTNLLFILALLNSNFAKNWFYENAKHRGIGVDVGVEKLRQFPVPDSSEEIQEEIIALVNSIIKLKNSNKDTTEQEDILNKQVSRLY